jgi:hypothetical protein
MYYINTRLQNFIQELKTLCRHGNYKGPPVNLDISSLHTFLFIFQDALRHIFFSLEIQEQSSGKEVLLEFVYRHFVYCIEVDLACFFGAQVRLQATGLKISLNMSGLSRAWA